MHASLSRIALGAALVASLVVPLWPVGLVQAQTALDVCGGAEYGWEQVYQEDDRLWQGASSGVTTLNPVTFSTPAFDQVVLCYGAQSSGIRRYTYLYYGTSAGVNEVTGYFNGGPVASDAFELGPVSYTGAAGSLTLTTAHDNIIGTPDATGDVAVWVRTNIGGATPSPTPTSPIGTAEPCEEPELFGWNLRRRSIGWTFPSVADHDDSTAVINVDMSIPASSFLICVDNSSAAAVRKITMHTGYGAIETNRFGGPRFDASPSTDPIVEVFMLPSTTYQVSALFSVDGTDDPITADVRIYALTGANYLTPTVGPGTAGECEVYSVSDLGDVEGYLQVGEWVYLVSGAVQLELDPFNWVTLYTNPGREIGRSDTYRFRGAGQFAICPHRIEVVTGTNTPTPTSAAYSTVGTKPTYTPTATRTVIATRTATPSRTPTITNTPTQTSTGTSTSTPSATSTPQPTATYTSDCVTDPDDVLCEIARNQRTQIAIQQTAGAVGPTPGDYEMPTLAVRVTVTLITREEVETALADRWPVGPYNDAIHSMERFRDQIENRDDPDSCADRMVLPDYGLESVYDAPLDLSAGWCWAIGKTEPARDLLQSFSVVCMVLGMIRVIMVRFRALTDG